MSEPTNAVILERLNNLIDANEQAHKDTNTHLKELNGRVEKHSKWLTKHGDAVPKNTKARQSLKLYWLSGVMVAGGVGGAAGGEVKALLDVLLSMFAGT
jgi:hypothetical protein|tara:strand:- start:6799 stop:7095 length:297 start_codon:yes stop_codon:yes gene_type:complete